MVSAFKCVSMAWAIAPWLLQYSFGHGNIAIYFKKSITFGYVIDDGSNDLYKLLTMDLMIYINIYIYI